MAANLNTQLKSKRKSRRTNQDSRRKLLKSLAGTGSLAASAKAVPTVRTQPLVDTAIIPGHAASTAGCVNAQSSSTTITSTSPVTFTVPAGVCEIFITAFGGSGGGTGNSTLITVENGEAGFEGQSIPNIVLSVTPLQELSVVAGTGGVGGNGTPDNATVPATQGPGNETATTTEPSGLDFAGGGGAGGDSRVYQGGTEFVNAQGGQGGDGGEAGGGEGASGFNSGGQEGGAGGPSETNNTESVGGNVGEPGSVTIQW